MSPFITGTVNIETLLAFVFGVFFIIILLIFAAVIPQPSETTFFIFRVVLSLCAAGIGAVVPGLFEFKLPGVRAAGAVGLAAAVYLVNPPSLVRSNVEKAARESLQSAYSFINRDNMKLASDYIHKASINSPEPVDVPFCLAL